MTQGLWFGDNPSEVGRTVWGPAVGTRDKQSLVASFPKWTSGPAHIREIRRERVQPGVGEDSGVPHEATSQVGLRGEGVQDTPCRIMWVQYVHFLQE